MTECLHDNNKETNVGNVHDGGDSPFSVLTPRERDVMDYVARGKPNKIIAAELGVSQRTIEAHRARIFQKMQVRNAVELAHCVLSKRRQRTEERRVGKEGVSKCRSRWSPD